MIGGRSSLDRCSLKKSGLHATIFLTTILLAALPAVAGLGEDVSSVEADEAHMQASPRRAMKEA